MTALMLPLHSFARTIVEEALCEQNPSLRLPLSRYATLSGCDFTNGNTFLWAIREKATKHFSLSAEAQLELWRQTERAMSHRTSVDALVAEISIALTLLTTTG